MAGLTYPTSDIALGKRIAGVGAPPGAATGLAGITPSAADLNTMREQSLARVGDIPPLAAPSVAPAPAPQVPAAKAPPAVLFSQSTNKMSVNGFTFDAADAESGFNSQQFLGAPAPAGVPEGAADWVAVPPQGYQQYIAKLSERRSVGQDLKIGARNAVGATIGGVGRAVELAGGTETGRAIAEFSDDTFGASNDEQFRSALISQSNTLWENIVDATVQGAPSLVVSALASIGGTALGGPALGALGLSLTRARQVGGVTGAAASIFPMELKGMYDNAVQNGFDIEDSATQNELLVAAAGSTLIQSFATENITRGFSAFFRNALKESGEQVARGALRNAAAGAVKSGMVEGMAEATAQVIQSAVFDPEFRAKLSQNDINALLPYAVKQYGEEALIAFGAGAILGGALGGIGNMRSSNGQIDLTGGAQGGAVPATETLRIGGPEKQLSLPAPQPGTAATTPDVIPMGDPQGGAGGVAAPAPQPVAPVELRRPQPIPPVDPVQLGMQRAAAPRTVFPNGDIQLEAFDPAGLGTAPVPPAQQALLRPAAPPEVSPTSAEAQPSLPGFQFEAGPAEEAPSQIAEQLRKIQNTQQAALAQQQAAVAAQQAAAQQAIEQQAARDKLVDDNAKQVEDAAALEQARFDNAETDFDVTKKALKKDVKTVLSDLSTEAQTMWMDGLDAIDADGSMNKLKKKAAREALFTAVLRKRSSANAAKVADTPTIIPTGLKTGIAVLRAKRAASEADAQGQLVAPPGAVAKLKAAAKRATDSDPTPPDPTPPAPKAPVPLKKSAPSAVAATSAAGANKLRVRPAPKAEATVDLEEADATTSDVEEVAAQKLRLDTATSDRGYRDALQVLIGWSKDGGPKNAARIEAMKHVETAKVERPAQYEAALKAATAKTEADIAAMEAEANTVSLDVDEALLLNAIDALNNGEELTSGLRFKLAAAWARLEKAGRDPSHGTNKLSDYIVKGPTFFNLGGRINGIRQVVAKSPGRFSLNGWNSTLNIRAPDGAPLKALPMGRVRMGVATFAGKLATKPKIRVYKDQADMRRRDPALYRAAAAARSEGDFDTADAAGYSFGDGNVVIFADRIASDRHLNFVLAHETVGHFGMRGLVPEQRFAALMESIYDQTPSMQLAVDAAMEVRGMQKAEAVEEYMADYAAELDTSLVARVWNAVKGALAKLGLTNSDEHMRYFISQARSYVRQGRSGLFDAEAVMGRMVHVETSGGDTGRFSSTTGLYGRNLMAERAKNNMSRVPTDLDAAWKLIRGKAGDTMDSWDKFKASTLSLANFRSRVNPGAARVEMLLRKTNDMSMAVKVSANEYLRPVLDRAIMAPGTSAPLSSGRTPQQLQTMNTLLYEGQRVASSKLTKLSDLGSEPLFKFKDGKMEVNTAVYQKLKRQGRLTFDQAQKGTSYTVVFDEDGETKREKVNTTAFPKLEESGPEWQGYLRMREQADRVEMQLLEAKYNAALATRDFTFRELGELTVDKKLRPEDKDFFERTISKYNEMYTTGITEDDSGTLQFDETQMAGANTFIENVNRALLATGKDGKFHAEVRNLYGGKADDYLLALDAFKSRFKHPSGDKFILQNRMKDLVLSDISNNQGDQYTKRTIAVGYTPVLRDGNYQIRVEALDSAGNPVQLAESYQNQLIYSQVDTESEAVALADEVNGVFGDLRHQVSARDPDSGDYRNVEVTLRAVSDRVRDAAAVAPEVNYNEFIMGLRHFEITLSPKKMQEVIIAMTRQNNKARQRLQRVFVPGADTDAVRAMMKHIEGRASTIAKTSFRPQLAEAMNRNIASVRKLWEGDAELLAALKTRANDANLTPEQRADAQREHDLYAYQYANTRPAGKPTRFNQYYNETARTLKFLDDNANVDESDFGSGPTASWIRAATSVMQLGGSVATGALNFISVATNGVPYLASYNNKTAFGGGFGLGRTMVEIQLAMRQVGLGGLVSAEANTAEFYDRVSKSPELQTQHGITDYEARFIAREIREGAMIPAQSNALVGTARGRASTGLTQKALDVWMLPFNRTEQASRRGLGLAAYRMFYARKFQTEMQGRVDTKASREAAHTVATTYAREEAVKALEYTMGEYSVLNRPPTWRSGIQSFVYMYKVFPTTSVQLMANMSRNGKIGMLAALWTLSGVAGLPFAEDLEDIIDTMAQKLGFPVGSIRNEIAKFVDGVAPGMSPEFLRGLVGQYVVGDVGGRTSLGDMLPGTDLLLAGADKFRAVSDIAGPAPAMLGGLAQFAVDLIRVPFSDTKSLGSVARESPVTIMRGVGDAYAYYQTGAIVDRRGYVVSRDMSAATIAARVLGFYPEAAAQQYSMIRISQRMTNYQKELTTGFRQAWINAMMRNDRAQARAVEDAVKDWNRGAAGSALEMRNFLPGSQKALREARRPAADRTLRATPTAAREDIERMMRLLSD